jgi:hypothetical protein
MKFLTLLIITFLSLANIGCGKQDKPAEKSITELQKGLAQPFHQERVPVEKAKPLVFKVPKDKTHEKD